VSDCRGSGVRVVCHSWNFVSQVEKCFLGFAYSVTGAEEVDGLYGCWNCGWEA
jgi:hypothetical protein